MANSTPLILVPGATGKTGSRVANNLTTLGLAKRTAARSGFTHSILRPAWFMQNFSETFLKPVDGAIVVPTGDGAEAFIDAEDIAAVAAATLADPDAHAGAQYALTGPRHSPSPTRPRLAARSGQTIAHVDLDRDAWIAGAVASGIPGDYGAVLRMLTETIGTGHGSRPNDDLEKATGVAPTSFADFARRTATGWAVDESR